MSGAFAAGIFHVVTHAFFKALLFLGAGSVIHALSGEQDLRKWADCERRRRSLSVTLLCAALAISGFPFTSGFFSKDAILEAAYQHAPWILLGRRGYCRHDGVLCFPLVLPASSASTAAHAASARIAADYDRPADGSGGAFAVCGGFFRCPAFPGTDVPAQCGAGSEPTCSVYIAIAAGLVGIALAYVFYVLQARAGRLHGEHFQRAVPLALQQVFRR